MELREQSTVQLKRRRFNSTAPRCRREMHFVVDAWLDRFDDIALAGPVERTRKGPPRQVPLDLIRLG
jgi:hypothetical protein